MAYSNKPLMDVKFWFSAGFNAWLGMGAPENAQVEYLRLDCSGITELPAEIGRLR